MAGYAFSAWSGDCASAGDSCTVKMSAAKNGSGTVTSTPAGINCGSTCSAAFNFSTSVALAATPATGYTFTGWSGTCTGTGACTVSMGAAKTVTANFTVIPPPKAPSGLTATAKTGLAVALALTDNATDEKGFIIERSTNQVNWTQIAAPGVDRKTYSDSGLTIGITYYYRIRAYNQYGESANATSSAVKAIK